MTDERKNEIWAMLDTDAKKELKEIYTANIVAYNFGFKDHKIRLEAIESIFGKHNLTSQAGEKPKEPRFKVGDRVRVMASSKPYKYGSIHTITELHSDREQCEYLLEKSNTVWFDESSLDPYTKQTDETVQKSPSHGENEPNLHVSEREMTPKSPSEQKEDFAKNANCTPKFKVGDAIIYKNNPSVFRFITAIMPDNTYVLDGQIYDVKESDLNLYTKPKEEVKISEGNNQNPLNVAESDKISTKEDAYFAYRLDLAKEIAVAMVNEDWSSVSVTATAIDAVDMANEIVKRLKETEI